MRFRKLRIAWTVFCGIACVLLVVLWVRSYVTTDTLNVRNQQHSFNCVSAYGEAGVGVSDTEWWPWPPSKMILLRSPPTVNSWEPDGRHPWLSILGFRLRNYLINVPGNTVFQFAFPYWFAVVSSTMFAALPWIRWSKRFSLRTLLLATTLIAVVLGLIVWLS
jgi:hypothetical protein